MDEKHLTGSNFDHRPGAVVGRCNATKKDGSLCKASPSEGSRRCHFHGGQIISKEAQAEIQERRKQDALNAIKPYELLYHTMFEHSADCELFEQFYTELKNDPSAVILAEAAALRVRLKQFHDRMDANGFVELERAGNKTVTKRWIEGPNGKPTNMKEAVEVQHTSIRKVAAVESWMKALDHFSRLVQVASSLNKEPPRFVQHNTVMLTEVDAARIMRQEFGSAGALEKFLDEPEQIENGVPAAPDE